MPPGADPFDPHALTLARAQGRRLCKLRHADGFTEDYDNAFRCDLSTVYAPDLASLADLLGDLAGWRDTCVLRGAIADPMRTSGVRRLLHDDPRTGDGATLRDASRAWLALDMDDLPLPVDTDPRDLEACGKAARAALPAPFHHAAAAVQATACHGFKPGAARLRLWFLLTRPLSGAACRRWLRDAPVDRSVFGAAQPIYTAAPLFVETADPLPRRLAVLRGHAERVAVPDPVAVASSRRHHRGGGSGSTPPVAGAAGTARYALAALARAATRVATAPVSRRHDTALAEAWGLARLVRAGLLSEAEVTRTIGGAIEAAGKAAAEGEAVTAWAVAHRREGTLPEGVR